MKAILISLVIILLSSCATLTKEQKARITEDRTWRYIDRHYDALGANKIAIKEIRQQYK